MAGVIFSMAHTDISCITRLFSVCFHVVNHLTAAVSCHHIWRRR